MIYFLPNSESVVQEYDRLNQILGLILHQIEGIFHTAQALEGMGNQLARIDAAALNDGQHPLHAATTAGAQTTHDLLVRHAGAPGQGPESPDSQSR